MKLYELISKDILDWRKKRLKEGGFASDIDWLLDIGGGFSLIELQRLYLYPSKLFCLEKSLQDLRVFINSQMAKQQDKNT